VIVTAPTVTESGRWFVCHATTLRLIGAMVDKEPSMDSNDDVWAFRLGVAGGVFGVIAVITYYATTGYVNPIAGVLVYAAIGYGIGWVIDRVRRGLR
jgi:hypothetical protein